MLWQALFLLFLRGSAAWPRALNVTRHFHTTDKGQLHYVVGGDVASGVPPLVMLHSDPRSTAEFEYLVAEFSPARPFIAVDFYGMGFSEACTQCEGSDFIKFTEYAAAVHDIVMKHGVKKFVPVGSLKGTNPILALADIAGASQVEHVVQISPLMLPPAAVKYMTDKFIPSIMNPPINQDGSHLLKVWEDPSGAPFGPDGKPDNITRDLMVNEQKTIDFLRCRNNGARVQHQKAWLDFNGQIPATAHRVSRYAHFLLIHGSRIDDNYKKYNMQPEFSSTQLANALAGGKPCQNITVQDANEGILTQNSSLVAGYIERFIQLKPTEIV